MWRDSPQTVHNRHETFLRLVVPDVHPGLLAEWREWMQAAGMSRRTINDRVRLVEQFQREIGCDPAGAGWKDVASFLGDQRYSAGTRQTYHSILRAWFRWLVLMDYRMDDPTMKLATPRTPRREPHPITVEQLGVVLSTPMHRRTRWMILLGAYEGLRVHEIAKVRGEHVRGDRFRVTGKGEVTASLPLHDLVAEVASEAPRTGYWFPSHTRIGPIAAKSVSRIIAEVMRRAGVLGSAHSLRHFFGTEALRSSGGNLRVAQKLLRHANIATTVLYTLVDDSECRAAIEGLPVPLHAIRGRVS